MQMKNGTRGLFWGCAAFPDCRNTYDATPQEKKKHIQNEERKNMPRDEDDDRDDEDEGPPVRGRPRPPLKADTKEQIKMGRGEMQSKGLKAGFKDTGAIVGKAIVDAGAGALGAKAAEGIVLLARHHLGEHWPAVLDTPAGRRVAQVALPVTILFICQAFAENIPLAAQAEKAATLAVRGTAQEAAKEAIEVLTPFLQNLIQLGAGTPVTALIGDGE